MTRAEMLRDYVAAARTRRFRAGRHDCALFAAGWVQAVTGVDHAEGWRGYTSLRAGKAMLAEAGHKDHVGLVATILEEIPPAMARTGDIAVIDDNALGVVSAERVFVLRHDGVGHVSRMQAKRAFRV